jgi:hypothetical protein
LEFPQDLAVSPTNECEPQWHKCEQKATECEPQWHKCEQKATSDDECNIYYKINSMITMELVGEALYPGPKSCWY